MEMVHNTVHVQLTNLLRVKIPTPWAKILCQPSSYPNLGRVGHNIDSGITLVTQTQPISVWITFNILHEESVVLQATPFAERGRVWSRCCLQGTSAVS